MSEPTALVASEEDAQLIVKRVLESSAKSSTVTKEPDNLRYDLGNLAAFDISSINEEIYRKDPEQYLLQTSTTKMQNLIGKLFELPTEQLEHLPGQMALLPKPTTSVPREKPVPQAKPKTKWEKFAAAKGIQKKKKGSNDLG